ncbi:2-hydroxyacid dehydrogenase [Burkholderia oklahomensis]|uniref:Glyoxylate/hydroxypyruvate reductase B n=1 Tax=Burkholderia oklahomensis TaxID=342113 RepID=A0AAI8B5V3_9BURK|nr:D-glycerate dehydrogenase [Burkholderia oklahomensis]AIO66039.1 glyoxylate/hydroxypyruvate reductase B [Burkholderia oklahomensis]AJX31078.1 glyoxylate/hydroxypyruvate reductase B [Burkholderia oklahomensis C6786]AOI42337.1 D-glycerate dehydrogenase [Burkholderia oklahomensis EO147]AOI45902.1 D-glycerate dehydrogenase [Burkholderia oklahomensis C6786]KUY52735.1 D-glycerate dehydrogenase [Burkholderia oklahomensis EO147]
MKHRIVVYKPLPDDVLATLRERADVTVVDGADALARALDTADGALGASLRITPELLDRAPRLRAWSTISVGFDNFDVADLTRRGIVLAHTPDVLTEATADTVFALILASARRVVELAEYVKAGQWRQSIGESLYGTDVNGKTLGIVGLGRIGAAVARRAALGFRMRVLYTNRSANPEAEAQFGARRVELDELLATADFVCLQVPLSPDTRHLIGAREFAKMKQNAILVNASRGPVVDEAALIDALRAGTIRAAGLDVFEREPLAADSPLLSMNNVVALPHIGSATRETRHAMARCAAQNLVAALDGTLARNIVNRNVLPRAQPAR